VAAYMVNKVVYNMRATWLNSRSQDCNKGC